MGGEAGRQDGVEEGAVCLGGLAAPGRVADDQIGSAKINRVRAQRRGDDLDGLGEAHRLGIRQRRIASPGVGLHENCSAGAHRKRPQPEHAVARTEVCHGAALSEVVERGDVGEPASR